MANLTDLKKLDGSVIATFPSPSTAYGLQKRLLEDSQINATLREVAPGGLLPLLRSNQVDVALELEPSVSLALDRGAFISYSLAERYPTFSITGLTTLPNTCAENPDLCFKVTCALQKGISFIKTNPEISAKLLSDRFPEVPHHIAVTALERAITESIVPSNVAIQPEAWRAAIELRESLGQLVDISGAASLLDNTFADSAVASCGL